MYIAILVTINLLQTLEIYFLHFTSCNLSRKCSFQSVLFVYPPFMKKNFFFNIKNLKINWLPRFNTGDWKFMELFSLFSLLCKIPRFLTDWINVIPFFFFVL